MNLNIVTNTLILEKIKQIPYFKTDLGKKMRQHNRKGPSGVAFESQFAEKYYVENRRVLMKSGTIGTINIFTDYGISQHAISIFSNGETYNFDFNMNDFKKAGSMSAYLGALLKKIENDHKVVLPKVEIKKEESKKEEQKVNSDPSKLFNNPGKVSWDDLQEYLKLKKAKS